MNFHPPCSQGIKRLIEKKPQIPADTAAPRDWTYRLAYRLSPPARSEVPCPHVALHSMKPHNNAKHASRRLATRWHSVN